VIDGHARADETERRRAAFPSRRLAMPRVVSIDHLVLSVGGIARSKDFYARVLGFLGSKLKYDHADMFGWSNRKILFWIAQEKKRQRRRAP
jgi:hypothetical protein